jgi:hypothetical protein
LDLVGSNWIKLDQAIDKNGLYMFLTLDIHSLEPSGLKKHGLGKHEPDTHVLKNIIVDKLVLRNMVLVLF